jgi:glycosyltransferase involved in cell wall biosynthesis
MLLHVADRLSERGGAHRYVLGLLQALVEDGEAVQLAVGRADGTARAPCPLRLVPGLEARTRRPAGTLEALADALLPEGIHVHNVVNPQVLEWAAARGAVVTVQDHRVFCPGRGKWTADGRACHETLGPGPCRSCFSDERYFVEILALTQERLAALRQCAAVVVLSRYMKRELAGAGVPDERIEVVPPFVDELDPAAPPAGPPCVLFVGRLVEAKGVRDAIEAWRRSGVALPLVLAGTGPLRSRMILPSGCHVLGWVPHRSLSGLYRSAAAVLLPSRWQEPFGIAGLEALTLGVPVVAWDTGGVGEWHPGGETLVPWGDVDGLARALRCVVDRRERARPPEGFDRERVLEKLRAIYHGQGQHRAPSPPGGTAELVAREQILVGLQRH